jgi:Zn-dependent protease
MSDDDVRPDARADDGSPGHYPAPYPPPYATPAQYAPGYHPQPSQSRRWGKVGGGAAAGAGVAAKAGLLTKFFLLFKSAAILVKFKFAGSMALALIAYTWAYGWVFAFGFVALIAIHEFGHIAAFRLQGVKASMPTFIPFLGAYTKTESPVRSVGHLAAAALAGPAAGTVAGIGCLELSRMLHSPLLQVLGYVTFFLSFINLMPLWILDGAKIARVLHPAVFFGALAVGLVVELSRPSRMLPFLIILVGIALYQRWRHHAQFAADYHATPAAMRSWLGAGYACVALICLWGINVTYIPR